MASFSWCSSSKCSWLHPRRGKTKRTGRKTPRFQPGTSLHGTLLEPTYMGEVHWPKKRGAKHCCDGGHSVCGCEEGQAATRDPHTPRTETPAQSNSRRGGRDLLPTKRDLAANEMPAEGVGKGNLLNRQQHHPGGNCWHSENWCAAGHGQTSGRSGAVGKVSTTAAAAAPSRGLLPAAQGGGD